MKEFTFKDIGSQGQLHLFDIAEHYEQIYQRQTANFSFHSFAWNRGGIQKVFIDEAVYDFPANSVLPIMLNQSFRFENVENITMLQFNREFYCILNHDAEVGCIGFLFFGPSQTMFIHLDEENLERVRKIFELFEEELSNDDELKGEMLRMLLVRLIIQLTRLAKSQYISHMPDTDKLSLLRKFNVLVEMNYKKEKQVNFYAAQLHKSPKTLSNLFGLYFRKTPLEIIHERVILEAKRLFYYTDKSVKEIAVELGFEDVAYFSKFFKNQTSINPSSLKRTQ